MKSPHQPEWRLVPCPHPATSRKTLFRARDYITGDAFFIDRCADCGLIVTQPQPDPDFMGRYYPAGYYGSAAGKRFPGPVEWVQNQLYAHRARQIERINGNRVGRVLDVGCGRGLLLRQLQKRGWDVLGTERSDDSSAFARQVLGLPVRIGELAELGLPDAHFDAVIMWHVLEHVSDPRVVLSDVARLLRPGGVLLAAVPNFGSAESRLTRNRWFHLDVPRHLAHFTPEVLRQDLREVGLCVRKTSFFAAEYDFFSFAQSVENALGLRHNLLYNLLRGRRAKVLQAEGIHPLQMASALALAAPLGFLSIPVTLLAAMARQGATMTVFATKAGLQDKSPLDSSR